MIWKFACMYLFGTLRRMERCLAGLTGGVLCQDWGSSARID